MSTVFLYSIVFRGRHSWRNRNRRMLEEGSQFHFIVFSSVCLCRHWSIARKGVRRASPNQKNSNVRRGSIQWNRALLLQVSGFNPMEQSITIASVLRIHGLKMRWKEKYQLVLKGGCMVVPSWWRCASNRGSSVPVWSHPTWNMVQWLGGWTEDL